MQTKNKKFTQKHKNYKRHNKTTKKWVYAIDAARKTLSRTKSLRKAKRELKIQALANARKLFGSVGKL
jgi:hypothetical protein